MLCYEHQECYAECKIVIMIVSQSSLLQHRKVLGFIDVILGGCCVSAEYCNGTFSRMEGEITSTHHPQHYPNLEDCTYRISPPNTEIDQSVVILEFIEFDLENAENCRFDWIEVCTICRSFLFDLQY